MKPAFARLLLFATAMGCACVIHIGINPLHAAVRHGTSADGECVVLLHGLARTSLSMRAVKNHLNSLGYATVNVDYPSTQLPIALSADIAVRAGIEECRALDAGRIHFVTHSLGGLLVRNYLARNELPELGRVVMLAPPSQGSEAADAMMHNPLYEWLGGPAAMQIGTGFKTAGVDFPLGVIAGSRSMNPLLSYIIPGPDDGKVSVDRSRVDGMADFLVLPATHVFIMYRAETLEQTAAFLATGKFRH